MSFFRAKGEIFEDAQANLLLKNEKSKDFSKADHDNNNILADHFRILISKPFQSLRGRSYMYVIKHIHCITHEVRTRAQARNMSIGEHRHCRVTSFKYKDLYGEKTYRFCNLRK